MVLCLLLAEAVYQGLVRPFRFAHQQSVRSALVMLLVFSTVCGLFLGDYENEASHTGLAVTAIVMAVIDITFGIYILYCAFCLCWESFQISVDRLRRQSVSLLVKALKWLVMTWQRVHVP